MEGKPANSGGCDYELFLASLRDLPVCVVHSKTVNLFEEKSSY